MTTYFRNEPVATDDLDISQPFLMTNTNTADTVFGLEHYAFSNQTANQGLHNTVTTPPVIGGTPATTANPIFYASAPTTLTGLLQFSRGPNNAVPTVLTELHAPPTGIVMLPNTQSPLLDFTGLPGCIVKVYAANETTIVGQNVAQESFVAWNSLTFTRIVNYIDARMPVVSSGNILQLSNVAPFTLNPVVWTLKFVWIT